MNQELYDEATHSAMLSRKLIDTLLETLDYGGISFVNWSIDVLGIIKTRLERGDRITDEVSKTVYTVKSFQDFVKKNFSSYIYKQVYAPSKKKERIYFQPAKSEGGYTLVMTESDNSKTYEWISSMSKRFSLVKMIATGIVYVKDARSNTYQPFISENGKYCRYDTEHGKIMEIDS